MCRSVHLHGHDRSQQAGHSTNITTGGGSGGDSGDYDDDEPLPYWQTQLTRNRSDWKFLWDAFLCSEHKADDDDDDNNADDNYEDDELLAYFTKA